MVSLLGYPSNLKDLHMTCQHLSRSVKEAGRGNSGKGEMLQVHSKLWVIFFTGVFRLNTCRQLDSAVSSFTKQQPAVFRSLGSLTFDNVMCNANSNYDKTSNLQLIPW